MLRYEARSTAAPAAVWPLLARPERWHEWAPHVRGAWGLGEPEVRLGETGVVRLLGVLPVPATIVAKEPGRLWTWRVGPVEMDHRVTPAGSGSLVGIDVRGPTAVEALVRLSYGRLIAVLVARLARVACAG